MNKRKLAGPGVEYVVPRAANTGYPVATAPRLRAHDKAPSQVIVVLEYSQPGVRLAYFSPRCWTKYDRSMRAHRSGQLLEHGAVYDPVIHPG